MENTAVCNESRNSVKTDLSLLLECVKFQMKYPDLQRQALLTIHSICEKREDTVDFLREMGGVMFIYDLSKSAIVHSEVKETALFTLATLAEANVYCKISLCSEGIFLDLSDWLLKEDLPLRMKRVSVYLLSILVANNKSGQTLAQTTGCLENLLDLFRTHCPLSSEAANAEDSSHICQLWASVSSALCGCINNPQNGQGQQKCLIVFPFVKLWLEQISLTCTEVFKPLCSFISMAVANNSHVQETFSASGGLETLSLALVCLASGTEISLMSCQLSVIVSKTLSACIANNPFLASGLAQYGVVPRLISLLVCPYLDCEDRLTILLTVGYCTEECEEHQIQLVQCGGLPIMISLLAEDASEEVRKAATFILQTCKQATAMSLGGAPTMAEELEEATPLQNMEVFKSSARDFVQRIEKLEKRHPKVESEEQEEESMVTSTNKLIHQTSTQVSCFPLEEMGKQFGKSPTPTSPLCAETTGRLPEIFSLGADEEPGPSREPRTLSEYNLLGMPPEGGRVTQTPVESLRRGFKSSGKFRRDLSKEFAGMGVELKGSAVEKAPQLDKGSQRQMRCAGCILGFENVTSQTFAHLLSTCSQNCDMHMVLHKATEQYRAQHCKLLIRRCSETQSTRTVTAAASGISLTPRKQNTRSEVAQSRTGLIPRKRPCLPPDQCKTVGYGLPEEDSEQHFRHGGPSCNKDFSPEEVRNLLCGVKKHGPSWSLILRSYSFKPGRTTVDLARKYRCLKVI